MSVCAEETAMRGVLMITTIAAVALMGVRATRAHEGPWCAVVAIGGNNVVWNCQYQTFEECMPNVIAGNRGFCNRNPRWPADSQASAPSRHHPEHSYQDR
jgi:uncharacterized protein DUF3551